MGPRREGPGFEPGQTVERQPYDLLFGQRKAPDGTPLGRPPDVGRKAADLCRLLALNRTPPLDASTTADRSHQANRQSPLFFDLTLSLSKSISILHASLGESARLARQAATSKATSTGPRWSPRSTT